LTGTSVATVIAGAIVMAELFVRRPHAHHHFAAIIVLAALFFLLSILLDGHKPLPMF
jgi:hypothetical protein